MEIDGDPWFVTKDVMEVLTIGSVTKATSNLTESEVRNFKLTQGRARPNKLISESGLYKIIMRSNKPEARAFQDWVTQVVLPSIRKDGGYIVGEEKAGVPETPCLYGVLNLCLLMRQRRNEKLLPIVYISGSLPVSPLC